MLAAEDAIRAWVNGNPALVPQDGDPDSAAPIARGAYLRTQRSPADGSYLVISRALPGGNEAPGVAEVSPDLGTARIIAQAYAGTEEAAEASAAAYARQVAACTGVPVPCGGTGVCGSSPTTSSPAPRSSRPAPPPVNSTASRSPPSSC